MIGEWLRGAADFVDAVNRALEERRSGFSEYEAADFLSTAAGEVPDDFMDLDEFIATASDSELAAMADQHVVDAEVHCEGCQCPMVCGCGRHLYMEQERPGAPALWFHRDDDSPISLECARIRDGQTDPGEDDDLGSPSPGDRPADFDAVTAAYRAVMEWIDRPDNDAALIGCTPAMVAGVAVNAYRAALKSVSHADLAAHITAIRNAWFDRERNGSGNHLDMSDEIAGDLLSDYRITRK